MEYRLEAKPVIFKNGQKYRTIHIMDIQFHTTKKTATPSVGKKMQKAIAAEKPDRIYTSIHDFGKGDSHAYILELLKQDPDFLKLVQEEEANGYKVLISIPTAGIPVKPGEDTLEFLNSKNGQRVLRGIAKNKRKD